MFVFQHKTKALSSDILTYFVRYTFLMQNYRYVVAIEVYTVSCLTAWVGLMTVSISLASRAARTLPVLWLVSWSRSSVYHS